MAIKTKPLALALAISSVLFNQAMASYTPLVEEGMTVENETIDQGQQDVYGTANNTTISGGQQIIYGVANNTTIADGFQTVTPEGITNGVTLTTNTDTLNVFGTANDVTATAGIIITKSSGSEINHAVLSDTGRLSNIAGVDNDTVVNNGGRLNTGAFDNTIDQIAISNNAIINAGGSQYIYHYATSNGSTVNADGTLIILSGTANSTVVNSSGYMENNGGVDNNTAIKSGAFLGLNRSATDTKATSNNAVIAGSASLYDLSEANNWNIIGDQDSYVYLKSDTAYLNDSTLNSGNLWIKQGTATNTLINGGSMVNEQGADVNTVVNGGRYYLGGYYAASSSNLTVGSEGMAIINTGTLQGATVSGTMVVNAIISRPETITTLTGDFLVADGGKMALAAGANTKNANLTLSGTGSLYLDTFAITDAPYNYTLGTMNMQGGSVYYNPVATQGPYPGNITLEVDSLEGSGSFYMNTHIANLDGDFLTVKGEANGDFDVYIADSGISPTSDASLQIIQTGGGNADFTLANKGNVVDAGTYEYYLVADNKGGWVLSPYAPPEPAPEPTPAPEPAPEPTPAPEPAPEPTLAPDTPPAPTITPSTAAVLSMATVDPLIFQAELNTVRGRVEQVRSLSHDTALWLHTTVNRYDVATSAGAGYEMDIRGVTLGVDKSLENENSVTTKGVFFSWSGGDIDFDRGGEGNVDSLSAGAYASYLHQSGFYFDGILKINRFAHDVNARMTSGTSAVGDYNVTGAGANLQVGKYFYAGESYLAPYVSVTGFTSNSSDYSLSNGMKAANGPQRSVLGEAGVTFGHKFAFKEALVHPYLKLAVDQEFIDDNTVKVNCDHFANDLSGTRGRYQLGVNAKFTDRMTVHADAGFAEGAHVDSPWSANLGISWAF